MDNKNNEQWLKELAGRYAEEDGKRLRREIDGLVRSQIMIDTKNLDKKVKHRLKSHNYWKYTAGLSVLAAACFVIVLTIVWNLAGPAGDLSAPKESTNTEDSASSQESNMESEEDKEESDHMASFILALPANFTIREMEEEVGKTTYHLDHTEGEAVTVVVEAGVLAEEYHTLSAVTINGQTAYKREGEAEQLLAFEKDGYSYIMTCQQDFQALQQLGEFIL